METSGLVHPPDPALPPETGTLAMFPHLAQLALDSPANGAEYSTGILPSQRIQECVEAGVILADSPIVADQVQPASLDLRLGPVAYRVRASFLASRQPVVEKIRDFTNHEIDLTSPAVLERGCVYVVRLMERLALPSDISAKANPKSSTGRLDVFTRLITDYSYEFEQVTPGYRGDLYLEIVPRTFSVLVRAGTRMNQMRLMRGRPQASDALLNELHQAEGLVYGADDTPESATISKGLWISIDLDSAGSSQPIGYRAKLHAPLIDVDKVDWYDPLDYWEPIEHSSRRQLLLNPEDFYLLASHERICVPPTAAAEMVGYDPSVGEFRIHYAGFFDPGFGYAADDARGARAVLEVRSHEVPFVLEHRQRVGRFIYERLLAPPHKLYGETIGSSYQRQGLRLSKQFKQ